MLSGKIREEDEEDLESELAAIQDELLSKITDQLPFAPTHTVIATESISEEPDKTADTTEPEEATEDRLMAA